MREIKTNDRDRLTEMIKQANTLYLGYLESIDQKGLIDTEGRAEYIADYLIANGVILPPCKAGDTVYRIVYPCNGEPPLIIKGQVLEVAMTENSKNSIDYRFYFWADGEGFERRIYSLWCWWSDVGKTVFLTREEAEKFLEELNNNGN